MFCLPQMSNVIGNIDWSKTGNHVWQTIGQLHPTVGAAILALIGVTLGLLQNRASVRRQHLLLARREVYLDSCDITAESIAYLLTMAQSTTAEGLKVMQKLGGMNGKLHLIATSETLRLADQYLSAFLDEYLKAAVPKTKLDMNRIETELANAQINTLRTIPDQRRTPQFNAAMADWNQRIVELSEESQMLTAETIAATIQSVDRLDPIATEVTLSMRKDIELGIDRKWFRQLRQSAVARNAQRSQPAQENIQDYWKALQSKRPPMPDG